jgi:hypothetical protein
MRCRDFGARLVTRNGFRHASSTRSGLTGQNSSPIGLTGDAWVSRGTAFVTASELYPTVTDSNLTFMHESIPAM